MASATENGHGRVNGRRTWTIVIGLILAVVVLAAFVSLRRSQVAIRIGRADRETITESIATNGKIEALNNFEAYAPMATTVKKILRAAGFVGEARAIASATRRCQCPLASSSGQGAVEGRGSRFERRGKRWHQGRIVDHAQCSGKSRSRPRCCATQSASDAAFVADWGGIASRSGCGAKPVSELPNPTSNCCNRSWAAATQNRKLATSRPKQAEARASLAAAQELLKNSNIVAPREGMVYSLPVRQGAFVNAGDLLVQVADLHKVRVRAFVDEPEIGKLRKGQLVEVTWDAIPGRVWQGTVEALPTTVVQRGTRMVGEVTCVVENSDLKLLPNTNISVAVVIARQQDALTVPREAVHQDANGKFVFQVVNGELQRRDVKTSVANLTRIQVTSGLTDNAVLALGAINMQSLREGCR